MLNKLCLFLAIIFVAVSCHNISSYTDVDLYSVYSTVNKKYDSGKKQQLVAYLDSMLALKSSSELGKYFALQIKKRYYYDEGRMDKSLVYADSTLALFAANKTKKKYPEEYTHALLERGHVLVAQGKYDSAYEQYLRAKRFAESNTNIICSRNEYYYHIAMVLFRQTKYRESATYFERAYNEANKCSEDKIPIFRMQEVLNNIGLCFSYTNVPDSALYYFDSCISFIHTNGDKFGNSKMVETALGSVYGNKAIAFTYLNRLDSAAVLLKKSIRISTDNKEAVKAQKGKIKLMAVYLKEKRFAELYETLLDLRRSLDTLPTTAVEHNWKGYLAEYYEGSGQLLKSIESYKKFISFHDSIANAQMKFNAMDVDRELEKKEAGYQINLLKKDNELNRLYLWLVVGFSCLAMAIIILVYNNYRKSRKNINRLTLLNNTIEGQKIELELKNKEKDRIMDVVAHDLRSPVSGILSMSDIILSDDVEDGKTEGYVHSIKKTSVGALLLINELLDFGTITREAPEKEVTDIISLIEESAVLMRFRADEKKQVINVEHNTGQLNMAVSKEQIGRVMSNLITNAIKFSAANTVINVIIEKGPSSALITVADTGMGIPVDKQQEVFDMFTSAKTNGTAGERSYGLGLSITKQIVELHGGRIWLQSIPGEGTTFFVELPL